MTDKILQIRNSTAEFLISGLGRRTGKKKNSYDHAGLR